MFSPDLPFHGISGKSICILNANSIRSPIHRERSEPQNPPKSPKIYTIGGSKNLETKYTLMCLKCT